MTFLTTSGVIRAAIQSCFILVTSVASRSTFSGSVSDYDAICRLAKCGGLIRFLLVGPAVCLRLSQIPPSSEHTFAVRLAVPLSRALRPAGLTKKAPTSFEVGAFDLNPAASYSSIRRPYSTIGAGGLNGRVRDGIGCDTSAIATGNRSRLILSQLNTGTTN